MAYPLTGTTRSSDVTVADPLGTTQAVGDHEWNPELLAWDTNAVTRAVEVLSPLRFTGTTDPVQRLAMAFIVSGSAVYAPRAAQNVQYVTPELAGSTAAVSAPTVRTFKLLTPDPIAATSQGQSPTLVYGSLILEPAVRDSTAAAFAPAIVYGPQVVQLGGRASSALAPEPALFVVEPVAAQVSMILSSFASFGPTLRVPLVLVPNGRWQLADPETGEVWAMPINPDGMSPIPHVVRQFRHAFFANATEAGVRTFQAPPDARELEWMGWIHTKEHYDNLWYWAARPRETIVLDHLGRKFTVFIKAFAPDEARKSTRRFPWRMRYKMSAVLLGIGEVHTGTAVETSTAQPLS